MISFIQLPYRALQRTRSHAPFGPIGTALVLTLILLVQLGLLVWSFL
jgi:hypothetical protein